MSEFVIKLENNEKTKQFLDKLKFNFNNLNPKNMLLKRSFSSFNFKKDLLVYFNVTPVIPNVSLIGAGIITFLFFVLLLFGKFFPIILYGIGLLLLLSLCWTKYFFYPLLKRSFKKHNIKSRLL